MKNSILSTLVLLFSIFISATASAKMSSNEKLKMYQASSAKFDDSVRSSKFGTVGNDVVLQNKLVVDNLISATVLAKDCAALQAASPTLRPGMYNVYPTGKLSSPSRVACNPVDIVALILLLSGAD